MRLVYYPAFLLKFLKIIFNLFLMMTTVKGGPVSCLFLGTALNYVTKTHHVCKEDFMHKDCDYYTYIHSSILLDYKVRLPPYL
ncbi:hypothetical protein VNO80_18027 [Phaseolus coccineus]|uniref:Uncharacterized protein n=1 Tax=Phaseolus coccineus TaxID=3886 RepID=A0AAN9MID3_PHACN